MHYLWPLLLVLFVLAVYLAVDEVRYRREVKRVQTRPWRVIAMRLPRPRQHDREKVRRKQIVLGGVQPPLQALLCQLVTVDMLILKGQARVPRLLPNCKMVSLARIFLLVSLLF